MASFESRFLFGRTAGFPSVDIDWSRQAGGHVHGRTCDATIDSGSIDASRFPVNHSVKKSDETGSGRDESGARSTFRSSESRGRKSTRPGADGVVELTPFEFLDRLADLVPPPRKHRHRPAGGWQGGRAKPRLWLRPPKAAGAMDGTAAVKQARSIRAESQAEAGRHGARQREHRQATHCGGDIFQGRIDELPGVDIHSL